jgi:hypothetical protein
MCPHRKCNAKRSVPAAQRKLSQRARSAGARPPVYTRGTAAVADLHRTRAGGNPPRPLQKVVIII